MLSAHILINMIILVTEGDMHMTKESKYTIEQSITELELIVNKMESGNLPLQAALDYFEKGVKSVRECQKELKSAEQKINILTGDHKLKDFDENNDN